MADIQQLLQRIMSDPKIASSSNFADKVYRDEPILFTAPQLEKYTPPKIREMRKLTGMNGSEEKIFYEQGRFMESFEDEYEYRGEFVRYFPTYQAMSDAQLRGYFSWRGKVRKGVVEKTSLSFVFVYIYELLNQIGVSTPEEGFHTLKNFWAAYRDIEPRIDNYAALWLKDYVVYNNLDKSLLEGLADADIDKAVVVLLDYKSHSADAVFTALNSLSSYDMENSRFFRQYPDEVRSVVCRMFSIVSDYYNRNPKKNAREKLFGRICANPYLMFKSAVFHHRVAQRDRVYEMGSCHKYTCERGGWSCERFVWYGRNNKQIGALLKTVDYLMRQAYDFKSTLQPGKTNKILRGKIEKEIARHLQEKRDNEPQKIDIDVSKLQGIRVAALATQNRLLVDKPEEDEPPLVATELAEGDGCGLGLSDAEFQFMRCLVHGEDYSGVLRSHGVMLSVLCDGVNEKLFDLFSDTVIADDGNGPELIEEYREELKGMIPR